MNKYSKLNAEWRERIDALMLIMDSGKYPSKEVYAVHNYLFGLKEEVSTCGSCLRKRGNAIRAKVKAMKHEDEINAKVVGHNETEEIVEVVAKPEPPKDCKALQREISTFCRKTGVKEETVKAAARNGFPPLGISKKDNDLIRSNRERIMELANRYKEVCL